MPHHHDASAFITAIRSRPVRGRLIGISIEAIDTSISSIPMAVMLLLADATAHTKHQDAWAHTRFTALQQPHPTPSAGSRPACVFDLLNQAATSVL